MYLGEQYLLTTAQGDHSPTGSPCVILKFSRVAVASVRRDIIANFTSFMRDAPTRELAWTEVYHSFHGPDGQAGYGSALDVVERVVDAWLHAHAVDGVVLVPYCRVRKVSGRTGLAQVLPSIEVVVDKGEKIVACRVQVPFVPSVVRTANAMLSATVREQRVVVYCPKVGDPSGKRDGHAAPMFVALTRVTNIANVALATVTGPHDNMFDSRQPFQELSAKVLQWSNGQGYCRLYHCRSRGFTGVDVVDQGSADYDDVHRAQKQAAFFDWVQA